MAKVSPDPDVLLEIAITQHVQKMLRVYKLASPTLKFKRKTRHTYYLIYRSSGHDVLVFGLPLVWHYAEVGMREYRSVLALSDYHDGQRIWPGLYSVHHLVCHEFAHLVQRRGELVQRKAGQPILAQSTAFSRPHGERFQVILSQLLRQFDPMIYGGAKRFFPNLYDPALSAKGISNVRK